MNEHAISHSNDIKHAERKQTVLSELSGRYGEVMFSSLVTGFGLDMVLFRNDEYGGHVDTNHGVSERHREVEHDRKNGTKVSEEEAAKRIFKKNGHQTSYVDRKEYDPDPYHKDQRYIDKNRQDKESKNVGTLRDPYTGDRFEPNDKTDLDHTVSAKEHHNDVRRFLSQRDPVETANQQSNLHSTHPAVNRSKGAKSMQKFSETLEDEKPARQNEIEHLRVAEARGLLSDGERKRLKSLTARDNVNHDDMREIDQESRKVTTRSHNVAYYSSKDFLGTTAINAAWAGGKMAARQCIGMVLLELSIAVQQEMPAIVSRWRDAPSWKERLDFKELLENVRAVLVGTWARVSVRLKDFWLAAKDGIVAGVMSEIVTTIINVFTTTIKRVMRLVRNLWSGIVGTLQILVLNPESLGLEDKLSAVMRLLSVAVGGAVQPIVSEAIDKLMANAPLPGWLREPLAEFAGAAVGGVLSASLLYAIEKSPVVQMVADGLRRAGAITEAVCREVAALSGLAWQAVRNGTEMLLQCCTSPAANLLMFVACPPLGLAVHAMRATASLHSALGEVSEQQALTREDIGNLSVSVRVGLDSLQEIMRENTVLLRCVVSGQTMQLAVMNEIRSDIRSAVARLQQDIEQVGRETTEMVALRELQKELNQLSDGYRTCAAVMASGEMPLRKDLEAMESVADSVLARLRTSLDRQEPGAPARLPLLLSMAFAIAAWRDARAILGEPVGTCLIRAAQLREVVRNELVALTDAATLWQLAQERAWLIEQHVLLRRTLGAMEARGSVFGLAGVEVRIASDAAQARMSWNDGLQPMRDLLAENGAQPSLEVLPLRCFEDAEAWAMIAGLPMGVAVTEVPMKEFRHRLGIPENVSLGEGSLQLMRAAAEITNDNCAAVAREIA